MRAYIAVNYSKKEYLSEELCVITTTLEEFGIQSIVFVNTYQHTSIDDEKTMMQQALADIDQCDWLIAETSYKGIGIGVEAGYAKAKNKPVIYMRKKDAEHSSTVSGISDFQIIYTDMEDLKKQLINVIQVLRSNY